MKKMIFVIAASLLIMAYIISSCNKEKDKAEKFSTQSVEENKAIVENSGIELSDVMKRMETMGTNDVIINFVDLSSSLDSKGFLFSGKSKIFSTLNAIVATTKGKKGLNSVFDAMIYSRELKSEDPESIQEFWDENVGTYSWNPSISDWDEELGGDKIIFKFPSSESSSTDDATITIYNYAGINNSNPIDEEYTGDLPVSLNADLKVGSEILVSFVFGASYNSDGVPDAIAADLTIENFKFEVDISNNTKVVSVNYKFLENEDIVMSMGATGNGLFTDANYEASTIHHSETYSYVCDYVWNSITQQYDEIYCEWTDEWDETEFEEILHSADAHFRLFNIELRGEIDIKGLVDQINIIDEELDNDEIDSETADARYVSKINEYLNLRMVNLTNNEIMAKAEAYIVHESDYGYEDSYIDFRLTFGDDSPIDLETYFDEGFDTFINQLNDLLDDINSDYDTDMEPIDY
jgi:hypothetical protein